MFITSFGEQNITYKCCSNFLIHLCQFDCVSRYFAPAIGINEDPVTGSIHTAIAPLWAEKLDQTQLIAYQASVRGGILECVIESEDRIEISGYAKLYMQAELTI